MRARARGRRSSGVRVAAALLLAPKRPRLLLLAILLLLLLLGAADGRQHRHRQRALPYLPDNFFVPPNAGAGADAAPAASAAAASQQPADVLALNSDDGGGGGGSGGKATAAAVSADASNEGDDDAFAGVPSADDILPPQRAEDIHGERPGMTDEGLVAGVSGSVDNNGAGARAADPAELGLVRVTYKQLLARSPNGSVVYNEDLGMELPQPWDRVNLTRVLADNLAPMARYWKREAPRRPRVRDIFVNALNATFYKQSDTHRVVVIRNNVITFPLMPTPAQQFGCGDECNPQLAAWLFAMRAAVRLYGLRLPDVVFSLSVQDGGGRCLRDQWGSLPECIAPSLSVSQFELATDLLAPMMLLPDANVTWRRAPWRAKSGKAFFRGVPSCGEMPREPGVCGRTAIARLAAERRDLFDAGLVEPHKQGREEMEKDPALKGAAAPLPVLPRARRNELAMHKYLLNLDGHSAAYRFAMLLATNSLVLKQHSRHLEWFYRSVRAGEHYLPVLFDGRDDALKRLEWAAKHDAEARAIARRANRFALTYTTYYARVLYWVYALRAYRDVFADQDDYFKTRGAAVNGLVLAARAELAADARRRRKEALAAQRAEFFRARREERARRAAAGEAGGGEGGGGGAPSAGEDENEEVIGDGDWRRRRRR